MPNIGTGPFLIIATNTTATIGSGPGTRVAYFWEAKGFTKWHFHISGSSLFNAGAGNGVTIYGTLDDDTSKGLPGPSGNDWFPLRAGTTETNESNPLFTVGDQLDYDRTLCGFAVVVQGFSSGTCNLYASATP